MVGPIYTRDGQGRREGWGNHDCIPHWQLCRTCCDIAQKIEKNVGNEMLQSEHESLQINKMDSATTDYSTSDIDSDEARK